MLSPETVRTHVRNAMAKLGASTRSQAVALALQQQQITADPATRPPQRPAPRPPPAARIDPSLGARAMLDGLVALYDVDGGAIYLADEDGLSLRRVAAADGLGVARARRARSRSATAPSGARRSSAAPSSSRSRPGGRRAGGALIAAPMIGARPAARRDRARRPRSAARSAAASCCCCRRSRTGSARSCVAGGDVERRLERAMERFRASWSARPAGRLRRRRVAQISVSASARSEASSSWSIGATASTAQSSSTRRIGAAAGTTRRSAWRRAASRRPRSNSRWMPELSR